MEFQGGLNALYEVIGALTRLVGVALLVVGALALLVKLDYEATKLAERS